MSEERHIRINRMYQTIPTEHDARVITWLDTQHHYKESSKYSSIIYDTVYLSKNVAKMKGPCPTILKVIEQDCIYAALEVPKGEKVCILNMADWTRAGGAVDAGSRAQEEELFRRSNLHMHLHQNYYPMSQFQTIYSTNVEFFKDGFDKGYARMSEPRKFDVISAPALVGPATDEEGQRYLHSSDVATMKTKIRNLLFIAAGHQIDTLILSAWGCGAFGCPPTHTAEIFKEVIEEFDGLIPNITFAIIGYNYEPFAKVLQRKIEK